MSRVQSDLIPEIPKNHVLVGKKSLAVYVTYVAKVLKDFDEVVIHARGRDRIGKAMDVTVQAMVLLRLKAVKGTVTFPLGDRSLVPTLSIILTRNSETVSPIQKEALS